MADDSNSRSYRPADHQHWPARPAAGGPEAGPDETDPLAELARLIGQSEPFGDLSKDASRRSPPESRPQPAAMPRVQTPAPASPPESDPYGSPLQFGEQQFGGYTEPQQERFQPAYDPAVYGTPQQEQAAAYPPGAYYDDPPHRPQAEEAYEDDYGEESPPPRLEARPRWSRDWRSSEPAVLSAIARSSTAALPARRR